MAEPLSVTAAVDLIRAAAQDPAPTEQPEITAQEQPIEEAGATVEAGELEIEASTDVAEEIAAEDETPEELAADANDDADDDADDFVELPEVMQRGDDGEWYIETNVFGEKSLERLDSVIARAQKDKAADHQHDTSLILPMHLPMF